MKMFDLEKFEERKQWWESYLPPEYTEKDVLHWLKSGVDQKRIVYKYFISCQYAVGRLPELYAPLHMTSAVVQAELKAMEKRVYTKRKFLEQILCFGHFRNWWCKELHVQESEITDKIVLNHLNNVNDRYRLYMVLDAWVKKLPFARNSSIHKMVGMVSKDVQARINTFLSNAASMAPYDYNYFIRRVKFTLHHNFYIRTDRENLKYGMTIDLETRWPEKTVSQHYLLIIKTTEIIARKLELEIYNNFRMYSPKLTGYNEYLSKKKLKAAGIAVHDLANFACERALQYNKKSVAILLHPNKFGAYEPQILQSAWISMPSRECCNVERTDTQSFKLENKRGWKYLLTI